MHLQGCQYESEVRHINPQALNELQIHESHWQIYVSSVVLDLKLLKASAVINSSSFKSTTLAGSGLEAAHKASRDQAPAIDQNKEDQFERQ